jgi:hypothetical protein
VRTSVLAAACLAASVATATAQGLGGTYRVAGKIFDGSGYSGTAEIIITSDTTCRINWKIGSEVWRGICMRSGSVFAASYRLGNTFGLLIYEINPNGTLEGSWTFAEKSGVGTETLTPMR